MHLSIYLLISLSLSIYISIYLLISLSLSIYIYMYISLNLSLPIYLSIYILIDLFLSIYLSIHLLSQDSVKIYVSNALFSIYLILGRGDTAKRLMQVINQLSSSLSDRNISKIWTQKRHKTGKILNKNKCMTWYTIKNKTYAWFLLTARGLPYLHLKSEGAR